MHFTYTFTGIGTHWQIIVSSATEPKELWRSIAVAVKDFEDRFSRFKPDSLVNQFKTKSAGTYKIDPELAVLLNFAGELKDVSAGKFNPAISELLSLTGYDDKYSFNADKTAINDWVVPNWSMDGDNLTIDGPISFDLGGFGKGYLIDKLSRLIESSGFKHYLVDGGGDMYGTRKDTDLPWQIAIQNPEDNSQAIATVDLDNTALAVSDIFKRRWQTHNHIIDPDKKSSQTKIIACTVLAMTAMVADGLTTCYMLTDRSNWPTITQKFGSHYMVIKDDHEIIIDPNWPATFL